MARAPICSRNTPLGVLQVLFDALHHDPDFSIIGVLAKYRDIEGRVLHIWLATDALEFLTSPTRSALIENRMGINAIILNLAVKYFSPGVAQFRKLIVTRNHAGIPFSKNDN